MICEREREREIERAPLFPSGSFLCYFLPQNKIFFFFLFFLFSFSNTPSQRRAAQERDPFSLLSFPFLSFPLLSFPFYFVCVCVNMNAKAVFLDHVFMLSFIPKSPSDFCPFVSLSIPAEYGANWWRSCIVFWSRTQSPRVKTQHPYTPIMTLLGNPTDPDPFAFDY